MNKIKPKSHLFQHSLMHQLYARLYDESLEEKHQIHFPLCIISYKSSGMHIEVI